MPFTARTELSPSADLLDGLTWAASAWSGQELRPQLKARVRAMRDALIHSAPPGSGAASLLEHLNDFVFKREAFVPENARTDEALFLREVLRTKRGNCFSLGIFYLWLGRELGLDLDLIRVPRHLFLRLTDHTEKVIRYVEVTEYGTLLAEPPVVGGRILTHGQSLQLIAKQLALAADRHGRHRLAEYALRTGERLGPVTPDYHFARALHEEWIGNVQAALFHYERARPEPGSLDRIRSVRQELQSAVASAGRITAP